MYLLQKSVLMGLNQQSAFGRQPMSKTIVNLSIAAVNSEVTQILADYPQEPYQQLFADQALRQKLIVHVLSRMPGLYAVIQEEEDLPTSADCPLLAEADQQQIEQLIHEGIQHLTQEYSPEAVASSDETPPENSPSHWFG
jgi:hypothetical protein